MVIPAARLKFYRRVNLLKKQADGKVETAGKLVSAVLHLWRQRAFTELNPHRAPYACAEFIANRSTQEFARWLAVQPFNEAAYWLASAYAMLVGEETQAERALFFTPPALAERVIDHLVANGASLTDQHWHDPACGGAAFLVPIAQRMSKELARTGLPPVEQLRRINTNLSGNDLDPQLLELSKSFLEMALFPLIQSTGQHLEIRLLRGDGLLAKEIEELKPDVLAVNPPYRKLNADEVEQYRSAHSDILRGQPNIYGLFINRALQLSAPGGLVGLLTPTSFLSGQSFSKLRQKLITSSDVLHIDMLSDRTAMFINVEQETAITVLRKAQTHVPEAATTGVSVLEPPGRFSFVGNFPLPSSGQPWPVPRAREDARWLQLAEASAFRLSDYGYQASIGHLVGYRDKRPRFISPPARPKKPGPFAKPIVPLIWATDITPGGRFSHGRETLHDRSEQFVEVQGFDDGVITKPAVLMQRLTSSDQKRRLVATATPNSFLRRHGGFVCENHVIVLEPVDDHAMPPQLLARLLNTNCVDRVFRCISGATNVAIFELNELLLPNPEHLMQRYDEFGTMDKAAEAAYEDG